MDTDDKLAFGLAILIAVPIVTAFVLAVSMFFFGIAAAFWAFAMWVIS